MGISLNRIAATAKDVVTADKLAQVLGIIQDQTATALVQVPDKAGVDGIVRVDTASGLKSYSVKEPDQHVVGITNGGPLVISLPAPTAKRVLGVIGSGANAVTVQRSDGKAMSFGASKSLTNAAAVFVADGQDWYLG